MQLLEGIPRHEFGQSRLQKQAVFNKGCQSLMYQQRPGKRLSAVKGIQSYVRSLQHEVTRTHVKDIVANPLVVNPIAIHNTTDYSSCSCNPCVSVRSNLLVAGNVSSCNGSTMSLNSRVSHTPKDKSKSSSGSLCQSHCFKKTHSTYTKSQLLSTSNACIQTDFIRTSVSCIQTALCQFLYSNGQF